MVIYIYIYIYIYKGYCLQEVAQSAKTTLNETNVTSLNSPPPSYVDISKKEEERIIQEGYVFQ
jgi:hypothetical protein